MKILILKFPYSSQFGGGEKHTLQIAAGMKARGHEVFLASSCKTLLPLFYKERYRAARLWAGVEPVTPASALLFLFLAPFLALEFFFVLLWYRFRRKVRLAYCLSLTEKIIATPIARLLGMRVVWMEHVMVGRWLLWNPWRFFFAIFAPLVQVITVSNAVKESIVKAGVASRRIAVIYNGIDVDVCEFVPALKNYREHFTIGVVSRLHKEKGVEHAVQALKIIKEFVPNARLMVIGEGPERQNLVWLVKKLELSHCILFVGFQNDVAKWMKDFDIFVLPSVEKEAFGIVSLEALACGKPIVATRVGGIPEIVEPGRTGVLVEPRNPDMLAQAVINLHRHPEWRREMGILGRKLVEEHFSERGMINAFEAVFQKNYPEKKRNV